MKHIKHLLLFAILLLGYQTYAQQLTSYNSPGNTFTLTSTTFPGNVEINALTTVIIPFGTTIKLKENRIITVKLGAKLIIQGKVTNEFPDNNLKKAWGISLLGDTNFIQPNINSVINNQYPGNNPNTNGVVIVENGVIENCKFGIRSVNGGLIYANNLTARNNVRTIAFSSSSIPMTASVKANPSLIKNSTFYQSYTLPGQSHISIEAISRHGMIFDNCTFHNDNLNEDGMENYAIALYDAGASIRNCTFYDFYYESEFINKAESNTPIFLFNSTTNFNLWKTYIEISNNTFNDCIRAIKSVGPEVLTIKNNTFNAYQDGLAYKAYVLNLDGSNGLKLEGNTFNNFFDPNYAVVRINNSGQFGNKINNNIFNKCYRSFECKDNNRGLQFKCNEFNYPIDPNNPFVSVSNISVFSDPNNLPLSNRGIPDQGAKVSNDVNGFYLPGNLFTQLCQDAECDLANSSVNPNIKYYTYPELSNKSIPLFRSPNVLTEKNTQSIFDNRANGCASYLPFPVIITRKKDAILLKSQVITDTSYHDKQPVINYLKQYIEALEFDILRHYMENKPDSLIAYLSDEKTKQKRCFLINLHLGMGNTGLALAELDSLIPEPEETDLIVFRNYYLKLIQLSQSLSSWSQISAADFAYFVAISESFTPTASKAKCLIKQIMNASNNQSLMKAKPNANIEAEPIVLQVYPNPLKDKIYIKNTIALQTFEIYDLNGAFIEKGNLSVLSRQMGTNKYPQIRWLINYFLEIEDYHKIVFLQKLISFQKSLRDTSCEEVTIIAPNKLAFFNIK
jgi:hypothetical protein